MVLLGDIFPIDWAAVGAALTGIGALLAGIAALKRSKNEGRKEAREQMRWEEEHKSDKTISLP
jgi:hypothetical protein